jgi:hypothetical protein
MVMGAYHIPERMTVGVTSRNIEVVKDPCHINQIFWSGPGQIFQQPGHHMPPDFLAR